MASALGHIRVIDASELVAGQFCARLLADFGADVVKLEPARGSRLRREPPFLGGVPHPENSLLFWHLNAGKRSAVLELDAPDGAALLHTLAAAADLVITSGEVDCAALRQQYPELITCELSGFGSPGPMSLWRGSELIYQAAGGTMFATGDPTREPILGSGRRANYLAGTYLYVAALSALFARPAAHAGQHVDVSIVESVVASLMNFTTMYEYNGHISGRQGSGNPLALLQCQDGWVVLYLYAHWDALCGIVGAHELAADPRFASAAARLRNWSTARELLGPYFLEWSAAELVRRAQAEHITMTKVMTPADLLGSEHLLARGYWQSVDTDAGERVFAGPPFRMQATPRAPLKRPPRLGEHTAEVFGGAGLSGDDLVCLAAMGTVC